MRTGARVAALLVVAAVVALAIGLARTHSTPAAAPAAPTTTASTTGPHGDPSASAQPTPDPSDVDATTSAAATRQWWEPTVRGFGGAFTQARWSRQKWRAALAPYAEPRVRADLGSYDRGQIPDQRYVGYDVLDASDSDIAVQVNYSDGWAVVLYLHAVDQQHWLVHAYDRLEE